MKHRWNVKKIVLGVSLELKNKGFVETVNVKIKKIKKMLMIEYLVIL